ncbi:hypothetical protein ACSSS7_006535 [Eimeria intestinalis]
MSSGTNSAPGRSEGVEQEEQQQQQQQQQHKQQPANTQQQHHNQQQQHKQPQQYQKQHQQQHEYQQQQHKHHQQQHKNQEHPLRHQQQQHKHQQQRHLKGRSGPHSDGVGRPKNPDAFIWSGESLPRERGEFADWVTGVQHRRQPDFRPTEIQRKTHTQPPLCANSKRRATVATAATVAEP